MVERCEIVVFSDLDGCLLDRETYECDRATSAVEELKRRGIPLVLCSSKTQAEVEVHRARLGLSDPFIVENGGAILIPVGHFRFPHAFTRIIGPHQIVEFGVSYARLTESLREIRRLTGLRLRGFSEMTVGEIAALTGLDPEAAGRAKARRYDEPFAADLDADQVEQLNVEVRRRRLTLTRGGQLYHLTGKNTKGLAVEFLTRLYRLQSPQLTTVGVGDGPNDLSMLERVDHPVVVPQDASGVHPVFQEKPWIVAPAPGPAGWSAVIQSLLSGREAVRSAG